MRIWIINHYAAPKTGSLGTRHAVLAEQLQRQGHEAIIFAAALGHHSGGAGAALADLAPEQLYGDQQIEGVPWRFIRVSPYANALQRLLNMRSFRRNLLRSVGDLSPPDVVLGSTVHPYAADAGLRLARRYGASFVYEVRDVWPESLADVGALSRRNPLYWHLRGLERKAFRAADGVVILFPGMQAYTQAHGVPPDRICYLPNGVDPSLYASVGPPPKAQPFVVSFFGSHGPANGLMTVLDAAARLESDPRGQGILLRLVGDGTQKAALQEYAQRLHLKNVEFGDSVPKAQLATLAERSHAFIFCLRRMPVIAKYGMSANKLFDYLLWARPVIFACESYNNPVAEAGAGLSIAPEDAPALAEAIIQLRDASPAERDAMGQRGREYVLERHNLTQLGARLESFLQTRVARSALARQAA